jgi:hypothetical protein
MTNLGLSHFFLGIQVLQMDDGIFISQPKYVLNLLQRFKMEDHTSCATPYQLRVKLTKECDSPKVDATLYKQQPYLFNSVNLIFTLLLEWSLDSCRIRERVI